MHIVTREIQFKDWETLETQYCYHFCCCCCCWCRCCCCEHDKISCNKRRWLWVWNISVNQFVQWNNSSWWI